MVAKYSSNSTEVIGDDAKMAWGRIKNAPPLVDSPIRAVAAGTLASTNMNGLTVAQAGTIWTVNFGNCNCVCDCNCESTCFLAGTPVLMADGLLERIEEVQPGACVQTMTGPARVLAVEQVRLGVGRQIIALGRGGLLMSDDHRIWSRLSGVEDWGTYNFSHWQFEAAQGAVPPHPPRALMRHLPTELAHVSGWVPIQPRYVPEYGPDTAIYQLKLDNADTFIAGGFVVSSYADGAITAGRKWEGLK